LRLGPRWANLLSRLTALHLRRVAHLLFPLRLSVEFLFFRKKRKKVRCPISAAEQIPRLCAQRLWTLHIAEQRSGRDGTSVWEQLGKAPEAAEPEKKNKNQFAAKET
jgi:hypothetical protein